MRKNISSDQKQCHDLQKLHREDKVVAKCADLARIRERLVEIAGAEKQRAQATDRSRILPSSISPVFTSEGNCFGGVSMHDRQLFSRAITHVKKFLQDKISSLNPTDKVVSMSKTWN